MKYPVNESRLLIDIESFVIDTVNSGGQSRNFYPILAGLLMDFDKVFNDDYHYSACVDAFVELKFEYNDYLHNHNLLIHYLKCQKFSDYQKRFEDFHKAYLRELRNHRYNESKNKKVLQERMQNIINQYARILVVRVDLAYLQAEHDWVDIELFNKNANKLRQQMHNRDTVFDGLIEYAWALEQGESKGYHCHLLLVYKGYQHWKAYGIAKEVGKLWQKITNDQGCYFNCHDAAYLRQFDEQDRLGVGMIYRNDPVQIGKMLDTVQYLARPEKEAQHLRVKCSKWMRTFG